MPSSASSDSIKKGAIIVIRHGERLDYVCRDLGVNWIPTTDQPWNPPLTKRGLEQGRLLGEKLREHIKTYNLPPEISHIYSSPLIRCVQTASEVIRGYEQQSSCEKDNNDEEVATSNSTCNSDLLINGQRKVNTLKVKIEFGLIESMNEDWYRSWSLSFSDSTWGCKRKKMPLDSIDYENDVCPAAKMAIQSILNSLPEINQLYHKHSVLLQETDVGGGDDSKKYTSLYLKKVANAYDLNDVHEVPPEDDVVDLTYTRPYHTKKDYQWGNFESRIDQCDRVEALVEQLAKDYPEETVIIVSHGGPVTHLFERLTKKHWNKHGMSKYTCCSIYVHHKENENQNENENADKGQYQSKTVFQDVLVNDCSHLEDPSAGEIKYV